MKKAIIALFALAMCIPAFAGGAEERYGRTTDPDYDYVLDNTTPPATIWENHYETLFDTTSKKFIPTVVSRSCTGLAVFVGHLPIRNIEIGLARNEPGKTSVEIYVISDAEASATATPVAAVTSTGVAEVTVTGGDTSPTPEAAAPQSAEVISRLRPADLNRIFSYRLIGRHLVFNFWDLPPTTKMITVKVQSGSANGYAETNFRTQ